MVPGDKAKARGYFEAARQSFEQWLTNKPTNELWPELHALAHIAQNDAALGRKGIRNSRSMAAQLHIVRRSTIHSARLQTFKRCLQSFTCGVANAMPLFSSLP